MKMREISLDFTSLLDVIMIILFFFILYSTVDVEDAAEKARAAEASYTEQLRQNESEQQEWREKASEEWERILSADINAANNQKALSEYGQGGGISFNLHEVKRGDEWSLSVLSGNKKLDEIGSEDMDSLKDRLRACLQAVGCSEDDVIIGTFTYDGSSYGTEKAVPVIENAIRSIQRDYKCLYFTSINISK